MICNLIIDGNYLLNKNVFTLHKNNLLFGALYQSLENSIQNYRRWYPFAKIYLVSDSKEKSWRKKLNANYKSTRKKNDEINWEFVHQTYNDFKRNVTGVKVLEYPTIEGDDWISFIVETSNKSGISNVIVSNDYDIKQLISYRLDPIYINIMSNEMMNKQKIFLPKNYQIFRDKLSKTLDSDDIFNLNDNGDFIKMLDNFVDKYEVITADPLESLIVKVISGDSSDNISPVWQIVKNNKKRGIGEKGAKDIFIQYVEEFGEPKMNDPDLNENIADLICEKKKLSKLNIEPIKENISKNIKLIHLDLNNIPNQIVEKMKEVYGKSI
jgi:5'-3' exonuclease